MKKLLQFLAIIVLALILIVGLKIASCSYSEYIQEEQENQKPLLKAMREWAKANPNPDHDTSPAVLKFIPLNTPKDKALNILTQNGFNPQVYKEEGNLEQIQARYIKYGTPCRYDFEILLKLKAEKVTKTSGNIHYICL